MAVSVHWATGTVFCSPLSLLASNMGCIISKTKCSGFSKRNVSVRKHYILSIPVSDRSPKCLESKFWAEWGGKVMNAGWQSVKDPQNVVGKIAHYPRNAHKTCIQNASFRCQNLQKFWQSFATLPEWKLGCFFGVLQGCDVNLWYFDFRKMGEIDSISFEIRVFLMKKARNRAVLTSKTSDFSRQNIRTFGDKHPYFCPKKSDVFAFSAGKPRKMPFSRFCNISDRRMPWWPSMAFSGH